jgi:hypothetical protein
MPPLLSPESGADEFGLFSFQPPSSDFRLPFLVWLALLGYTRNLTLGLHRIHRLLLTEI